LLERGAYVGAREDYGRTPLHLAAVAGSDKAVEQFLGVGEVECDSIDRDGRIPLHLAAIKGSEVVRWWLDKSQIAAINTTDNNRCTPLDLAIIFGHENVAILI
ncbi:ankyrin repeat-containing domain protein, partial [Trichophaea hybrida]